MRASHEIKSRNSKSGCFGRLRLENKVEGGNPVKKDAGNGKAKVKAKKVDISQLIITSAYEKVFSSGKIGFFGQGMDSSGQRYQIIGAVKIG